MRQTLQIPRLAKKEGRRCIKCQNKYSAVTCREDHAGVVVSWKPVEVHGRANTDIAAHEGPHTRAGRCALNEVCTEAGSWKEPWSHAGCHTATNFLA